MPSKPAPQQDGVSHRDVIAGGLRMHVAEAGPADGPPVLLVHGWPQHHYCWNRVVPDLSRDHRLLMPDLRGFGWSEATSGGYEKENLLGDLIALLDALGVERVTYVGHDWGGFIGFLFGMRAPERLEALINLSIPHPWPSHEERRDPRRIAVLAYQVPITLPLVAPLAMRAGMAGKVMRLASRHGTFSDQEIELYDATFRTRQGARTTTGMYRTFLSRELLPMVRGRYEDSVIPVRTHLAVGSRDGIMDHASLGGYEGNAPQMTTEVLDDVFHFLPEERPDVVVARVREITGLGSAEGPR